MTPRLSVVVPFYNVAEYIGECLESLRRQTFDAFEVILVDDGSLDATALIAEEYCRADPRFQLVVQANQGLGPARNTGVQYSSGEYITFVDSDDLVPRHAFEVMIHSLDETGSSFAAAGARRFDDYGSWGSWLHGKVFAANRPATHVVEYDQLAIDRMVWNKVFRRSFWDEFGYAFPAIRYEDYPVTLKAYLDAVTVDIVAQPNYYWRERTSGDSITQRRAEFTNLCDRIRSADMVLNLVEELPAYLRNTVHMHLAQVDMVTLVDAFGELSDEDCARLARIAQCFAERIDKGAAARSSYLGRLQHNALRNADIELLRTVAEIRRDGALGTIRGGRTPMPWRRQSDGVGPMLRLPGRAPYAATTTVTDLDWITDAVGAHELVVRGTAEIRHLPIDATSKLRMVLEADGVEVPLPVERFPAYDSHGDRSLVGYSVRVPHSMLAGIPARNEPATLRATITQGHVKRTTVLRNVGPGNPSMPPGAWINGGSWLQPVPAEDNRLLLRHIVDPARLDSAVIRDDVIVLHGHLPHDASAGSALGSALSGRVIPDNAALTAQITALSRITREGTPPTPEGTPPTREGTPPTPEGTPPTREGTPPTPEDSGRTREDAPPVEKPHKELTLSRTWAKEPVSDCEIVTSPDADRFTARIPLAGLVQEDDPDDPVTGRTVWRLQAGGPVLALGLTHAVTQVYGGRLIQVSRAPDNCVVITEGPVRPIADDIGLSAQQIVVSGQAWGALDVPLVWRRTGSADVACSVGKTGTRWTSLTDVDSLIAGSPRANPSAVIWQLVALPIGTRPYAVQPDAFLAADASITVVVEDRQLTLRPHSDRVTVEVR
ncbi:MAG: glycosyltransferase [Hamadaea sp.]|uniref:glycosyltransferase n=1 Tax=Hamadaea sp. TaxID=2024425 RepID=UPI00183D2233|nr:glycosyltransferase [Hamadaea sp.]NUR72136.1 glycosyltransferase [Hamadaea sp.]NUT21337.1 glycosyltransferase [Hamadaea sp.]